MVFLSAIVAPLASVVAGKDENSLWMLGVGLLTLGAVLFIRERLEDLR